MYGHSKLELWTGPKKLRVRFLDVLKEDKGMIVMIREILADLCHQQWSGWMKYLFSKGVFNENGTWTMPAWAVDRWKKQMNTPYANLSDTEQESDRTEADKFLIILIDDGRRGKNTVATTKDHEITD